jgi:N-acyl-D-amino-acid deacylase
MAEHGIILRGGQVVDGTGKARFAADVAIDDDRIAAIGDLSGDTAEQVIDATGRLIAPGFIDVHTHDDRMLRDAGDMTPKVSQGVTTVVAGNCGISLAPFVATERPMEPLDLVGDETAYRYPTFKAFVDELTKHAPASNAALMVGHGTLRVATMSDTQRPADDAEIEAMRAKVGEAMDAGATGFSTGLEYPPARHCETAEVIRLAEVAGAKGGIYATHMRDYAAGARTSLDEALTIGREAKMPVIVSHFHCHTDDNPGICAEALGWYEAAVHDQDVVVDAYPYEASSTSILPSFVEKRTKALVTWSKSHPEMNGKYLSEICEIWGVDPVEAAGRLAPGGAIYFGRDEENVKRLMTHQGVLIGSDGIPLQRHPHPRLWGTFPRVLGHYARDLGLMQMEDAIHRMTAASADRFGLKDRGRIARGAYADLVVFDPETIIDTATYLDSEKPAAGIDHVFVNGVEVWGAGGHTGAAPGRVVGQRG